MIEGNKRVTSLFPGELPVIRDNGQSQEKVLQVSLKLSGTYLSRRDFQRGVRVPIALDRRVS